VDKPAQERAQCAAKSSGDAEFNTATRAARRPEGIGMEGGIRVGMPHASSDCGRNLFAHPATRETDHLRACERDTKRASSRGDTRATAGRDTGRADCGAASGAGETASADCSVTSGVGETSSANRSATSRAGETAREDPSPAQQLDGFFGQVTLPVVSPGGEPGSMTTNAPN